MVDRRTKLRARKERLFERQNGLCCWCSQPMRFVNMIPGMQAPPDMVTLEHMDHRESPLRGTFGHNTPRTKLACFECNSGRGHRDNEFWKAYQKRNAREGEGVA